MAETVSVVVTVGLQDALMSNPVRVSNMGRKNEKAGSEQVGEIRRRVTQLDQGNPGNNGSKKTKMIFRKSFVTFFSLLMFREFRSVVRT